MRPGECNQGSRDEEVPGNSSARRNRDSQPRCEAAKGGLTMSKRRHFWRKLFFVLLLLALLAAIGRAIMPWAVRDYVNRTLDRNPLYAGSVGDVQIHLWRGAYSIHDIRISKTSGNIPVPFFEARTVD